MARQGKPPSHTHSHAHTYWIFQRKSRHLTARCRCESVATRRRHDLSLSTRKKFKFAFKKEEQTFNFLSLLTIFFVPPVLQLLSCVAFRHTHTKTHICKVVTYSCFRERGGTRFHDVQHLIMVHNLFLLKTKLKKSKLN